MKSQCYCISLRAAARKISAIYDEGLEPFGVNIAQFSMLRRIERRGPLSITELSQLCDLERSTTGRNVKVLERAGLVDIASGEDQREATVALSRGGRRVLDQGAEPWRKAQEEIEAKLGPVLARELLSLGDRL